MQRYRFSRIRRALVTAVVLAMLLAISLVSAVAEGISPPTPVTPTSWTAAVNASTGSQTDPHISGSIVAYTDATIASIRYQDLSIGPVSDTVIPHPDGASDCLPDVSGGTIVFTRVYAGAQTILAYDIATQTVTELAPMEGALRRQAAIGGRTVAAEDRVYSSGTGATSEITLFDVDDPAWSFRLTNDTTDDLLPAVSSDGAALAWLKCTFDGCDVWTATRNSAGDRVQTQLTASPGNESHPDTNGTVAVYASNATANAAGDENIHWQPVGGGSEMWLDLPGRQRNPNISGNLIAFESATEPGVYDVFVYDLSTEVLYRLTDTAVSEALSDVALESNGVVRVVWAQLMAGSTSDYNVYGLHFTPQVEAAHSVTPLFDQLRSYKLGSVVPIRLQVFDANGNNISSPDLVLTVTGLVQTGSEASPLLADDAGNSNPDNAFRYSAELEGYAYNLSTKGLSVGSWELQFKVGDDSRIYGVTFSLK